MNYELSLESYQGPLDKLLELVQENKLEITQISLAQVTADFLDYLKKLEEEKKDHSLITDFLVIASKLVLIKSKVLLPSLPLSEEEESDIKNLEERLKIYQEFKLVKSHIRKNWTDAPRMFSREFLMIREASFYPPSALKKEDFIVILEKLVGELQRIFKPIQIVKTEIINLKKKIEEIVRRLKESPSKLTDFKETGTKNELIVIFLAILHLIKEQLIQVNQIKNFEEIVIVKKEKGG